MSISDIKEDLLELIFPKKCVLCHKIGSFLCTACQRNLIRINTATCPGCNSVSEKGRFCKRCRNKTNLTGALFCLYFKDKQTRKIMYEYKYNGLFGMSDILAPLLVGRIEKEKLKYEIISYVPITKKRARWRGFNQSELLAQKIADITGVEFARLLEKIKETKSQVGLKKKERAVNLRGAFNVLDKEKVSGKRILLVDDVCTTGTTLSECARSLKENGAKEVWAITVAKE